MKVLAYVVCFLALKSCVWSQSSAEAVKDETKFSKAEDMGEVAKGLNEVSGLVASFQNPKCFWAVNDSGNPTEVFLIDDNAKTKVVCKLPGIKNRDWEDIAIGNGPEPSKKYLYIGEIGDNNAAYDFKYLYRFEEPSLANGSEQAIASVEKLVVKFPDGKRDIETLMIDQSTNDVYFISKRETNVKVYLQKFPYGDTLKPAKILELPFNWVTAGSISPDGNEVLIKSYTKIYYWKRTQEKSIVELLAKNPLEIPYDVEPQGEAICFTNDNSGFFTISETHRGAPMAQLKYYKRIK
jgi:hypothetical protein